MVFSYLVKGSERECFVVGGGGGKCNILMNRAVL